MKRKWIAIAIAGLLIAAGLASYRLLHFRSRDTAAYERVDFSRERIEITIEASGTVEPRNRIEIKPPIGGRTEDVLVKEGQQVTKGEIIALMSSTERAALLDAARAKGPEVLRKWEDAYKTTPLIAPLDGTIIARNTEPGQTVTAQDPIMVLSDRLIVTAQVDETDIGRIQTGQPARITLDAYPDVVVKGTVEQIAYDATTVNNVTIYEVKVEPESIPKCMKSGMTATIAFFEAAVENALTLPTDAVQVEDGKSLVLVEDGRQETPPEAWRVLTGLATGGRVEILAGLDGHEQVVRKSFKLKEKSKSRSPFMPGGGRPR
jgi:macrolide-specific efflux system membrane fusion protein